MDYSKKTAQECMEDYELHGVTVSINDGKVSGSMPAGGEIPFPDGTAGMALRQTEGLSVQ